MQNQNTVNKVIILLFGYFSILTLYSLVVYLFLCTIYILHYVFLCHSLFRCTYFYFSRHVKLIFACTRDYCKITSGVLLSPY